MRAHETPYTWGRLRRLFTASNIELARGLSGIIAIFVLFILTIYYWDDRSRDQQYNTRRLATVEFLNTYEPSEHDGIPLTQAIRLHESFAENKAAESFGFAEVSQQEIDRLLAEGTLIEPKPRAIKGAFGYFLIWLPIFLLAFFAVQSALHFIAYGWYTLQKEYLLVDLPWKQKWPYVFVALTIFPIGLPFYLVSLIRRCIHRDYFRRAAQNRAVGLQREEQFLREAVNLAMELPFHEADAARTAAELRRTLETSRYPHEPESSRQFYRELRGNNAQARAQRKIRQLNTKIEELQAAIQSYVQKIKSCRDSMANSRAKIAELQQIVDNPIKPDSSVIDQEFDRMLQLPGVLGCAVINDELRMYVRTCILYDDELYDMGDWEISVDADMILKSKSTRSGVKDNWYGYPHYRLGNGGFCFGARTDEIQMRITNGQILEAIELAIATMNSVNPEHMDKIPRAFVKIERSEPRDAS